MGCHQPDEHGSTINTITAGSAPYGAVVNPAGTLVYVTNVDSNTVSVISTATNSVVDTISVGVNPEGLALNPAGTFLYVANDNSNTVSVISTATNSVVGTIFVGNYPSAVAINPVSTTFGYAVNCGIVCGFNSGSVSVFNTITNAVVNTITVGVLPTSIAINPAGTLAFVTNYNESTVSVINLATNTVANTITYAENLDPYPWSVAVNPAGTLAYVTTQLPGVDVINTANDVVVDSIGFDGQDYDLTGMAISPDGKFGFAASAGNSSLIAIDLASNSISNILPIGLSPVHSREPLKHHGLHNKRRQRHGQCDSNHYRHQRQGKQLGQCTFIGCQTHGNGI